MLTARLFLLLAAAVGTVTAAALRDDDESLAIDFDAPTQWKFDSFPRVLRSDMGNGYSKKWANQVRFGKRSAGAVGQRSWASQVRFG